MYVFFTWYCCFIPSCFVASEEDFSLPLNSSSFNNLCKCLSVQSRASITSELEKLGFTRVVKKRKNDGLFEPEAAFDYQDWYSLADLIPQYKDTNENNIVHYACLTSNRDLLHRLIECETSIHTVNKYNRTAIFYTKEFITANLLLHHNASTSHKDINGHSAFISHVIKNNVDIVKLILQNSPPEGIENLQPLNFVQSIEMAKILKIYRSHFDSIPIELQITDEYLREQEKYFWAIMHMQPNINIQNSCKERLLHLAVKQNLPKILKLLLEKNISLHAQTSNGLTALHIAAHNGNREIVSILIEHAKKIEAQGFTNALSNLLEQEDLDGSTALMTAVQTNRLETVDQLIAAGAHIFHCNKYQHSLLHFVKDEALAEKLIIAGLSPQAQGIFGHTPLHFNKKATIANILLRHGANSNALTLDGSSPLHCANNHEIIELLIDHNALIDARNSQKCTPLFYAIKYNNAAKCSTLLQNNADINATDIYGRKATDMFDFHGVPNKEFVFEKLAPILNQAMMNEEEKLHKLVTETQFDIDSDN